jgi:hypothetical protein
MYVTLTVQGFFFQCILIVQRGFIVIFPYMDIIYFDQIHSLYYSFLPPLSSTTFFFDSFSGFYCAILTHLLKYTSIVYIPLSLPSPFPLPLLNGPPNSSPLKVYSLLQFCCNFYNVLTFIKITHS